MAKLNWQRVAAQQQQDRNVHKFNKDKKQKDLDRVWLLGQHYGKKLTELSLDYLIWASKEFAENNYHKLKADSELIRRHTQLIKAK